MEALHIYENLDGDFELVKEYKEGVFKKEEILMKDKNKNDVIAEFKRIIKSEHRITHHSYLNGEVKNYYGEKSTMTPQEFCGF